MNKQFYALTKILKKPEYLFEISGNDVPAYCFSYIEIRDLWKKLTAEWHIFMQLICNQLINCIGVIN